MILLFTLRFYDRHSFMNRRDLYISEQYPDSNL